MGGESRRSGWEERVGGVGGRRERERVKGEREWEGSVPTCSGGRGQEPLGYTGSSSAGEKGQRHRGSLVQREGHHLQILAVRG